MVFDEAAYGDLVRLQGELRAADSISDVVYTALELLGLALTEDLSVDSKYHRGTKRVVNLWR